jgi:predicted MFS family arabinose efflux permease
MLSSSKTLIKGAYGGLSKEVWLLSLVMLINRTGTMVIFFLSVYLTQKLHFTVQQTGVIMAFFGAGSFTGAFLGGKLTDKLGYHPVMFWSLLIGGLLFLTIPFIHSYLLLCISLFVLSTFSEAFRPANMTAISFYSSPETYTRSISLNRLAINLGFSVGPAVGGMLATYSYSYIFIANSITCLVASLTIWIFLTNKVKKKNDAVKLKNNFGSPYHDRAYLAFTVIAFLYALCFFQFFITMPLFYKGVHHFNEKQIGLLMALNGIIVAFIEMIMVYKIENRWSKFNFIALGAALLVISYVSIPFLHNMMGFVLLVILISFSEMFAMPFMNAFMNQRSGDNNRGQYAALYAMAWSTAQISIPIIATQTIANFGYTMLWMLLAFLSFLIVVGIKKIEQRLSKN